VLRAIDDMLWQFKDVSFVPHSVEGDDLNPAPVALSTAQPSTGKADILVNLGLEVPEAAPGYRRLIETAGYDESTRAAARRRYRYYQEQGYALNTHKISG